jgi:FkbM family methyltransferase
MFRQLADQALLSYGLHFPQHRGKWRVVEALYRHLGLAAWHTGEMREVERQGVRWKLDPRRLVQRALYYLGVYEANETAWLLRQVRPEWVALDVGANFGYYSLLLSRASGGSALVHAFEPEPTLHARLREHAELNRFANLHAHAFALSDTEGEFAFVSPAAGNEGVGHLLVSGAPATGTRRVPTLRLDDFVRRENLARVDFLKIDVEGAEGRVLAGARETLARFRPKVLMEVNPEALAGFGLTAPALLRTLRDLGYETYLPRHGGLRLLTGADGIGEYVNVVGLPR